MQLGHKNVSVKLLVLFLFSLHFRTCSESSTCWKEFCFNISFLLYSIMPLCSHKSSLRCVQFLRPFCWFNTRFLWLKSSVFSSRLLLPCQSVSLVLCLSIKKCLDYCPYNTFPSSQTTQSRFVALTFSPVVYTHNTENQAKSNSKHTSHWFRSAMRNR